MATWAAVAAVGFFKLLQIMKNALKGRRVQPIGLKDLLWLMLLYRTHFLDLLGVSHHENGAGRRGAVKSVDK